MKLSTTQKVVKFFVSKVKFKAMEQESKLWCFQCESCQKKTSIWEIGGIRYKAKGNPKIKIKCPNCGKTAMQSVQFVNDK